MRADTTLEVRRAVAPQLLSFSVSSSEEATRVVVVEDDDDLRALICAVLTARPSLEVVADVADGESALAACDTLRPAIVVLDLSLPDIAGRDVLTRLREQSPWIRVIIFTGSREATKATAATWGAAGLVHKDQDIQRLVRLVEQLADDPLIASSNLDQSKLSPSMARHFVTETLRRWSCDSIVDDALLVVSELVTNAVTHAASTCRLVLRLAPGVLRIEVADNGGGSPEPQSLDLQRASGRGLMIVSAMSAAWGIDPVDGTGKSVWAELAI
jgi:DNA-binding NarL/FixJ family response regulator